MKKIVFTLALVFTTASFAFATNNVDKVEAIKDCKITIKDNQTGKSHTITVHDESCGSLIKSLLK